MPAYIGLFISSFCFVIDIMTRLLLMISKRLHVGFRIHFFTLIGSDANLTFTLFRNCSIVFPYTALDLDINLKKSFSKLDLAIRRFLYSMQYMVPKMPSGQIPTLCEFGRLSCRSPCIVWDFLCVIHILICHVNSEQGMSVHEMTDHHCYIQTTSAVFCNMLRR